MLLGMYIIIALAFVRSPPATPFMAFTDCIPVCLSRQRNRRWKQHPWCLACQIVVVGVELNAFVGIWIWVMLEFISPMYIFQHRPSYLNATTLQEIPRKLYLQFSFVSSHLGVMKLFGHAPKFGLPSVCGTRINVTDRMSGRFRGPCPDTSSRWPVKRGKSCLKIRCSSWSRYLSHRSVIPFHTSISYRFLVLSSCHRFDLTFLTGLGDDLLLECDNSILTTRIESSCIFVGHNLDRNLKTACAFLISAVSLPVSRCSHFGGEVINILWPLVPDFRTVAMTIKIRIS